MYYSADISPSLPLVLYYSMRWSTEFSPFCIPEKGEERLVSVFSMVPWHIQYSEVVQQVFLDLKALKMGMPADGISSLFDRRMNE
ncbi:hypothetical protein KIN20_006969 [Parelaphostrongylus tenuis]|uniref:Uncharacterized protein n=1 Tax=Parelaphostrongylus tenuis TaxID=148309 RepID=A0AAD5M728_PARTN|nr:hypothetical protein KIN20_006969 [Parelaphostrongylus tenuis]